MQAKLLHYSMLRKTDVFKCTYIISGYCRRADTDQAYYDLIVKKASALLSAVQVNMLKFALSLRAYSATVHSFQQVAYKSHIFVMIVRTFPVVAQTPLSSFPHRLRQMSLLPLDVQRFLASMDKRPVIQEVWMQC